MQIDISSQPSALLGFNDRIIFRIFSPEIANSVRGGAKRIIFRAIRIVLPVSIVVNCCIKY